MKKPKGMKNLEENEKTGRNKESGGELKKLAERLPEGRTWQNGYKDGRTDIRTAYG